MLSGTVERVVFHNDESGFSIILVRQLSKREPVPVLGVTVLPQPGELIRAEGSWTEDRTWGRQFRADTIELIPPASTDALKAYLSSGAIKGIGRATAKKLISNFGDRFPEIIESQPERLSEVEGIGRRSALRIAEAWREQAAARKTMIFLQSHGIQPSTARRIFERYGNSATDKIVADPYLLARDVRGIGFATADRLASSFGFHRHALVRLVAGLEHQLREAEGEGHAAVDRAQLLQQAADMLGCSIESVEAALDQAIDDDLLVSRTVIGRPLILLKSLDLAEATIADRLLKLVVAVSAWSTDDLSRHVVSAEESLGFELANEQRQAILDVLKHKICIITGGPGTGKTTIVRAVITALASRADIEIALAAPTGRAARRLAASCERHAATLHRLLEADPGHRFGRDRDNPLECDFLVIDEMSMVDTYLFAATLDALPDHAGLLLVGDADQLPSVGPGQVLADLIGSSAVPVSALNRVYRQGSDSSIVANAYRIRSGQLPNYARAEDEAGDLFGIRADNRQEVEELLLGLVTDRIPTRFGLSPLDDIQIIAPTNKGPAGTRELNELLQRAINPTPAELVERGEVRFGLGDKVMQLENDYQREVSNGDIGKIVRIDHTASLVEVEIEGRNVVYGFNELDQLTLAYAITIHKSQGSEYPAVVIVIMRNHGRMLRRRLIYTAVTRARQLVVLLGQQDAIRRAVETRDAGRTTLLSWRLQEEREDVEQR